VLLAQFAEPGVAILHYRVGKPNLRLAQVKLPSSLAAAGSRRSRTKTNCTAAFFVVSRKVESYVRQSRISMDGCQLRAFFKRAKRSRKKSSRKGAENAEGRLKTVAE